MVVGVRADLSVVLVLQCIVIKHRFEHDMLRGTAPQTLPNRVLGERLKEIG